MVNTIEENFVKIKPKRKPEDTNNNIIDEKTKLFRDRLYSNNTGIIHTGEYVKARIKTSFKCKACGFEWFATPDSALRYTGPGCRKCAKKLISDRQRKTNEQYVAELKIINPDILLLGEYEGNGVNVLHKCLVCNYEWSPRPANLLNGKGCPACSGNAKLTHDQFKNKIASNIIYEAAKKPIDCECTICGYIWTVNFAGTLQKHGCPKCAGNASKTHEEFLNELSFVKCKNVNVLGRYVDSKTKITCLCNDCGYKWNANPSVLLQGNGCRKCGRVRFGLSIRKEHSDFIKEMKMKQPNIEIMGTYITAKDKIQCKCIKCNKIWSPIADDLSSGKGCPKCAGNDVYTTEEFKKKIFSINPDIEIIGDYVSAKSHIKCKCLVCSTEWNAITANLVRSGCPSCTQNSKLEMFTNNWLTKSNIVYKRGAKYEGLCGIGGRLLSYDFYLQNYNLLIECQGIQHEKPVEQFGGKRQLERQQEHDRRKREYAKLHNIHLLEIWYYDINNIEEIITNTLNNLKSKPVETVIPPIAI